MKESVTSNHLFIALENVARWLENGCDPAHAASELRALAQRVRPADVANVRTVHTGSEPFTLPRTSDGD